MKKSINQVLDEFFIHLCGTYSLGTSKWYVNSYAKPAIDQILKPYFDKNFGCNPFCSFNQSKSNSVRRSLIIAISESLLEKEIHDLALGKSAKTINNWRSGLRAFFAFLESEDYYFDCSTSKSTLEAALKSQKGSVTYSKQDMLKIFLSRLITQDRAYKHMIYPAKVLNQIFNNSDRRGDCRIILDEALKKTKFVIDGKGSSVNLKDISKLCIDYGNNGAVSICASGKHYDLYTENPTVTPSLYERFSAIDFGDLSLDHDTPLQNILDNPSAQTDFPALYELSCVYASFVKGSPEKDVFLKINDIRNFKKHSSDCFDKEKTRFSDPAFVNRLLCDLNHLYKKISFTIMLTSYNSSKGKGTTTTP